MLEATIVDTSTQSNETAYLFDLKYDVTNHFKLFLANYRRERIQRFLEESKLAHTIYDLAQTPPLSGRFTFKQGSNLIQLQLQFMSARLNGLAQLAIDDAIKFGVPRAILSGHVTLNESQLNVADISRYFNKQLLDMRIDTELDVVINSNVSFKSVDDVIYDEVWGSNDALGTLWIDCSLTNNHDISIGLLNHVSEVNCKSLVVTNDKDELIDDNAENFEQYLNTFVEALTNGDYHWDISNDEIQSYVETLMGEIYRFLNDAKCKHDLKEYIDVAFARKYASEYFN